MFEHVFKCFVTYCNSLRVDNNSILVELRVGQLAETFFFLGSFTVTVEREDKRGGLVDVVSRGCEEKVFSIATAAFNMKFVAACPKWRKI